MALATTDAECAGKPITRHLQYQSDIGACNIMHSQDAAVDWTVATRQLGCKHVVEQGSGQYFYAQQMERLLPAMHICAST
jgi:hypothetical protein